RLAEALVGPPQLTVFALELLEPLTLLARRTRPLPRLPLAPPNPAAQRLGRTADLLCDRLDRRPFRFILVRVLADQPNRPLPHLRRVLLCSCHRSNFSRVGASGKLGAIQPPIWVFVSPTAFIIDAHSTWAEAKRRWDYQTAPKVRYEYTGSQCTEASEFYLAQYEILDSMSDLGSFMGAMANTLEPLVCDIVPGKPLCVDLFIANSRALVFGGDDRTFNPEAGIDNSRVHLYINPETLEFEVAI